MDPKQNSSQPLDPKLQEVYDRVMGTNPSAVTPTTPTAPIDNTTPAPPVMPSQPPMPTIPAETPTPVMPAVEPAMPALPTNSLPAENTDSSNTPADTMRAAMPNIIQHAETIKIG